MVHTKKPMPQRTEETALKIEVQVIREHLMVGSTVKPAAGTESLPCARAGRGGVTEYNANLSSRDPQCDPVICSLQVAS